MERVTIPLRFRKSRIPLVNFRLAGDETYYALIDTGSETTLLDVALKDKVEVKSIEDEGNFVGIGGSTDYKTIEFADTSFILPGDIELPFIGLMHDMTALSKHFMDKNKEYIRISAIIGSDLLKKHDAKIDYKNRTLTISV
jgi:predicted aspartyl protease